MDHYLKPKEKKTLYYTNGQFIAYNTLSKSNFLLNHNEPKVNNEMGIQLLNTNTLVFKAKCSDGIIRSIEFNLS